MRTAPVSSTGTTHVGRGLLLVCAAGVVWGTIGPAVDVVHDRSSLSVWAIGGLRAVAALAVLGLALLVSGGLGRCRALVHDHRARVVLVGLLTAAFQLLFFVAVVRTGVSIATVVALGFAPVLLLVLGSLRRRTAPGAAELLPVAGAVLGLLLVGLPTGDMAAGAADPAGGVLAALGSGAAYALSAELGAPMSREHGGLAIATVTMVVASIVLVPGALVSLAASPGALSDLDPPSWLLIGYLGAVTMALAYAMLFAGLRTTPSGTAVVATLLEPVTAVLIAVTLLGESLTVTAAIGSSLIIAAIAGLGRRLESPEPQ